jgi:hypothetical protein
MKIKEICYKDLLNRRRIPILIEVLQLCHQTPSNSKFVNSWANKLDFSVMIVVFEKSSESSLKSKSLAKIWLLNSLVSWTKFALSSKNMLNTSFSELYGLIKWMMSVGLSSTFKLNWYLLLSLILFSLLINLRSFLLFLSCTALKSLTTSNGSSDDCVFYTT